jgi:2-polyprenyl-3-methyl-5-hydroxy-6-metoxy-1,4-benzoquinol methylase
MTVKTRPSFLSYLFNRRWWRFEWRYWRGLAPWDTQITPPEVMAFLAQAKPAKALDLGCGTGTNAITMARYGWQVTAVDFSPAAIRTARYKAKRAGLNIAFQVGDVSDLSLIQDAFDYALDIGCLFTLAERQQIKYAEGLQRLVRSKGKYMLYARLQQDRKYKSPILSPKAVQDLFSPAFSLIRIENGEDQGSPSAWYWLEKNKS